MRARSGRPSARERSASSLPHDDWESEGSRESVPWKSELPLSDDQRELDGQRASTRFRFDTSFGERSTGSRRCAERGSSLSGLRKRREDGTGLLSVAFLTTGEPVAGEFGWIFPQLLPRSGESMRTSSDIGPCSKNQIATRERGAQSKNQCVAVTVQVHGVISYHGGVH